MDVKKWNKAVDKVENYIYTTWKNKLAAIIMVACGIALMKLESDITALLLLAPLSTYLFFSKKNWIIGF